VVATAPIDGVDDAAVTDSSTDSGDDLVAGSVVAVASSGGGGDDPPVGEAALPSDRLVAAGTVAIAAQKPRGRGDEG